MADYATVKDLESRWKTLDADEADRAAVLLSDASVYIRSEIGGEPSDADAAKIVACNVVMRVMSAGPDALPFTATSVTAGPFSRSVTLPSANGDMYLTKRERKLLGISGQKMAAIRAMTNEDRTTADEGAAEGV